VLLRALQRVDAHDHQLLLVGGRDPVQAGGVVDAGYLKGAALASAVRGADFTVVPSIWADPCPATAVEALGVGKPVVATATGGLPDIVEHERTGLLVPPDDESALAAALQRMIDDRALRERLGTRAPATTARFSTAAVLPALEEAYAAALQ
jgi:glycosyltransferase involved in cell wall biosynthesis